MKSVSLLMGEAVYQAGLTDDLKYFGILPFPDMELVGLTYFFLIPDEQARGKSKAATVTIIVKESTQSFIFTNIQVLHILLDNVRESIRRFNDPQNIEMALEFLRTQINSLNIKDKVRRKSPQIVLTGLENSGKTSYINFLTEFYPLKIENGNYLLDLKKEGELSLLNWEFSGSDPFSSHRRDAFTYLSSCDVILYFVDIQDSIVWEESIERLSWIIDKLDEFNRNPIIMIMFSKCDPPEMTLWERNESKLKSLISTMHPKCRFHFLKTSISDKSTIRVSFSKVISSIFPLQDEITPILKDFTQSVNGHTTLLLGHTANVLHRYHNGGSSSTEFENVKTELYNLYIHSKDRVNSIPQLILKDTNIFFCPLFLRGLRYFLLFDSTLHKKGITKKIKKMKKQIFTILSDNGKYQTNI
jgi:hypothetical protein